MYCTDGFGYGYYWHFGNWLFILILLVGIAALVHQLIMHNGSMALKNSVTVNSYHSTSVIKHCPSCGKVIKKDWTICPYCETKLK